jgi:hypothetical protein
LGRVFCRLWRSGEPEIGRCANIAALLTPNFWPQSS